MNPAAAAPANPELPDDITALTGAKPEPIWLNEAGGVTVRFTARTSDGPRTRYLKRNPLPGSEDLALEAEKLRWLGSRHPVPEVVDYVRRGDVEFLITEAIPGGNAVTADNKNRPDVAIAAIGQGLRSLHSLPVADCPWSWSVEDRLTSVRGVEAADVGAAAVGAAAVGAAPEIDRLVVCHGDPCAPNTLLDEDGKFVGHVDMQRLGVADRWADLAVTTMSFAWNYETYDEEVFWEAYGIEPDANRIQYYRDLWNAE